MNVLADNKIHGNVSEKLKFVLQGEENIVGKGENAPAFSPFTTVFSKGFFLRVVKSRDCVVKGNTPDCMIKKYSVLYTVDYFIS